ncbi:MAG: hypothetical protein SPI34_05460 [Opitutales bacterium]|nr:hypothetical protein [Opitutales bacterium]
MTNWFFNAQNAPKCKYEKTIDVCAVSEFSFLDAFFNGGGLAKNGIFEPFRFDDANSPFKKLAYLKYLFGATLHRKCLFNTAFVRGIFAKYYAKKLKLGADFSLKNIPYCELKNFSYKPTTGFSQKNDNFCISFGKGCCKNAATCVYVSYCEPKKIAKVLDLKKILNKKENRGNYAVYLAANYAMFKFFDKTAQDKVGCLMEKLCLSVRFSYENIFVFVPANGVVISPNYNEKRAKNIPDYSRAIIASDNPEICNINSPEDFHKLYCPF